MIIGSCKALKVLSDSAARIAQQSIIRSAVRNSYFALRLCTGRAGNNVYYYSRYLHSRTCSTRTQHLPHRESRTPGLTSPSSYYRTRCYTTMTSSPAEIIASLPERYTKASDSGDLLFFPSTITPYEENGVEFEIRLCPALQNKPNLPTPHFDPNEDPKKAEKGDKPDPFAPPYNPNLLVGEVRDEEENAEYVVLFNKYSVVPHHILLVTKEFHSQTAPLLPPDLVQTYKFLLAARDAGRKFFAFYNCGNLSGASQPHKHLQLIPIDFDGPPIERLARNSSIEVPDRPFAITSLPYAHHIRRLPTTLSSKTPYNELSHILSSAFLSLLDLSISSIRHDPNYPVGPPSYNVILTTEHMHLIPRREETYTLKETGERLSVNALGFAGCLLVKSEKELEAVKKEGLANVLRGVGLKSVHELQVNQDAHEPEELLVSTTSTNTSSL